MRAPENEPILFVTKFMIFSLSPTTTILYYLFTKIFHYYFMPDTMLKSKDREMTSV